MNPARIRWLVIVRHITVLYAVAAALSLSALLVVGCLQPAPAQWGRRGCAPAGPVGPTFRSTLIPTRTWTQFAEDPGRWHLCIDGRQAGAYCPQLGYFRSYDSAGDLWGPPEEAPADLPPAARATVTPEDTPANVSGDEMILYNGGLIQSELNQDGRAETIWLGENKITITHALQAIESVPDFRSKPRITVSGSDVNCAQLRSAAKAIGLDLSVWSDYSPAHWHLRDRDGKSGFKTDADPTLYLQAPNGTVLSRMDGVQPNDVAKLRVQPPYDPAKDPDPRKPAPSPLPLPGPWPVGAPNSSTSSLAMLGLVALVLLLLLRHQPQRRSETP